MDVSTEEPLEPNVVVWTSNEISSRFPCSQILKPATSIPLQGREVRDALREQEPLDSIDELHTLTDQRGAFPAVAASIFFFGSGRAHHGADPWLTPFEGQQGSQQRLAVQPVRLGVPAPSRGRDRRHGSLFLSAPKRGGFRSRPSPPPGSSRAGAPCQFEPHLERLRSIDTKIAPSSVWTAGLGRVPPVGVGAVGKRPAAATAESQAAVGLLPTAVVICGSPVRSGC